MYAYIYTLAFGKPVAGGREFVCPGPETGYYPADDQCTGAYYTCVNGVAYPQVNS